MDLRAISLRMDIHVTNMIDESNCYSVDGGIYVYDAFDETDTESGLIGSTMIHYYHNEEPECPDGVDSCTEGHMELELSPGDYTIVTTSSQYTAYGNSFEFTNYIVDENGLINGILEWRAHVFVL